MNKDIMDLLALAFKAGINTGIIQASHITGNLLDKPEATFEDFLKLAKPLIELIEEKEY